MDENHARECHLLSAKLRRATEPSAKLSRATDSSAKLRRATDSSSNLSRHHLFAENEGDGVTNRYSIIFRTVLTNGQSPKGKINGRKFALVNCRMLRRGYPSPNLDSAMSHWEIFPAWTAHGITSLSFRAKCSCRRTPAPRRPSDAPQSRQHPGNGPSGPRSSGSG